MQKILSFDIEIYNDLEEDENGRTKYEDVIPSIAAFTEDGENVRFFWDEPYISKKTAKELVKILYDKTMENVLCYGWNTTSFDLRILGLHSEMLEECGEIALRGIDSMASVTFSKGYYLGLDTCLAGMGIESKLHEVKLKDGTVIEDFSGRLAPEYWRMGEYEAVKSYLAQDVISPFKLAKKLENSPVIKWMSKSGKPQSCNAPLQSVHTLFSLPYPNTSWMTGKIPKRENFIDWIPMSVQRKYIPELSPSAEEEFPY